MSKPVEAPSDGRAVYVMRLRVRRYELDTLGHVNNAVYVSYLEQAAIEHAEDTGFSEARLREVGGVFVVRRHEIDYLGAALAGDELTITTWPEMLHGPRAIRRYEIYNLTQARRILSARTLWIWVDLNGRPRPIPPPVVAAARIPQSAPEVPLP